MSRKRIEVPNKVEIQEEDEIESRPSQSCRIKNDQSQKYTLEQTEDETLQFMCRICMFKDANMYSIYDKTDNSLNICEMLNRLLPQLLIYSNDLLPKVICKSCLNKLFISYDFHEMCISTDANLRNILSAKSIENNETEHVIEHESVYIDEDPEQLEKVIAIEIVKEEIDDESMTSDASKSIDEENECVPDEIKSSHTSVELEVNVNEMLNNNLVDLTTLKRKTLTNANNSCASSNEEKAKSTRKVMTSGQKALKAKGTINNKRQHLPCPHCDKLFDCPDTLKRHLQVFKCDLCGKEFPKTRLLAIHLLTHPEYQKYKCTLCSKTFPYESRLAEHMNKHNGLKPFECEICEKAFFRRKALSTHMRTHKERRRHNCLHCGKTFKTSGNLSQHMMVHTELKPYLCDICGGSFARVAALEQHKQTHSDERPYNCDECDKSFKLLCQIKRHMKIHAGEKPHKCSMCDRAFTEGNDLKKHLRKHIGDNIYKCEKCPEAFEYKKDLQKHELDHYKEEQQLYQQQNEDALITELNIDVIC